MQHKAIGIIPARAGSKRIKGKNLVNLSGKPLIAYTINSSRQSKYLKNNIYVSTDDLGIARISEELGVNVLNRPIELATDESSTLSVLKHVVGVLEKDGVDFDTIVLLQPTSPLRKTSTIDAGIKKLWNNWETLDAVFSVRPTKFPPNWQLEIKDEKLKFIFPNDFSKIRSQDLDQAYEIDGVLYVYKKDHLMRSSNYPFAKNGSGYIQTDKAEAVDIDNSEDLEIVRAILQSKVI